METIKATAQWVPEHCDVKCRRIARRGLSGGVTNRQVGRAFEERTLIADLTNCPWNDWLSDRANATDKGRGKGKKERGEEIFLFQGVLL